MSFDSNPGKVASIGSLFHLLFVLCAIGPVFAVNPNHHITQFGHTAWRVQDGVFGGTARVLAQTTDGYLWIGTTSGLVRFDGVRFVPWTPPEGEKLPSQRINAILGGTDGSLWIGTAVGLSRWQNNHLTNYPEQRGVVTAIFEDTDATTWIVLARSVAKAPLCQVNKVGMRCYGSADGIPPAAYQTFAKGADGAFWIGAGPSPAMTRWKPGVHETFSLKGPKGGATVSSIAVNADGSLWTGTDVQGPGFGLQRFVQGVWKSFVSPKLDGSTVGVVALLLDRENALWVGTAKRGIYRIYGDSVEHFGSADGLSGDFVYKFFEDREGNVWAATSKGIDNFRDLRITTFSPREGLNSEEVDSVLASRDGGIWVGGPSSLEVLRDGRILPLLPRTGLHAGATSLFEDHAGRLWVGLDDTLSVYENGKFRQINRRDGKPTGMVFGLTEDTNNTIWVIGRGSPLIGIRDYRDQVEIPPAQTPDARRVVADPKGGLWFGLVNGDLARYQDGRTETYHFELTAQSSVTQVEVNPDGSVLSATAAGLIGLKNGKQLTLTTRNGLPCDIAYASVLDDQDNVWIYMQCGLVEIMKAELQNQWSHPDAVIRPRLFDVFDGAQPGRAPFVSGATRSPDGKLWFASGLILQMIDPHHLALNSLPPPVHVEGIVADRKNFLPQDGLRLPPLTRDLEIDYTALSFVVPQKVRFRYKLEGRDVDWQESGTRRQAYYTDLRPKKYRFRVIACNNDGVWNEAGAMVEFSVAPAWYQTNWFPVVGIFTALFLAWVLYRIRVRQISRAISARFDERLAERTRLARELHDTFLQTLQGSKMVAEASLNGPSDPMLLRRAIERLLGWLDKAIDEGRAALNSLRSSTVMGNDLAEAFQRATDDCRLHGFGEVSFVAEGVPSEMHPIVRDEIYRIGSEAIRNACQHSGGSRLDVRLRYSEDLAVTVSDNGKGIDPRILAGGRDGHFGLPGMRERATRIGARLDLTSSETAGTMVELIVPGRVIFRGGRPGWWTLVAKVKAFLTGSDRRENAR